MLGLSLALNAAHPPAPGPSFKGIAYADHDKPVIEYRQYLVQCDEAARYACQRAADGSHVIRTEMRPGDIATLTGGHRAELSAVLLKYLPAERITVQYAFMVEPGPALTSWMLIGQVHHDDNSIGDSPPFAIELDTDETLIVKTRNNAGTQTIRAQTAEPIVRGKWYRVYLDVSIAAAGTETLECLVAASGEEPIVDLDLSGLEVGYPDAAFNYWKFGVYGDPAGGGDRIAVQWKNMSTGVNGTNRIEGNDPDQAARILPTPFLDGIMPPTAAFAFSMHMLSSWTSDIIETETSPGRFSYVFDQSGNNHSLSQASESEQPTRNFPGDPYVLAGYFAGAGDLMSFQVDNDASDLIDADSAYFLVIFDIVGTPDNDSLTPANNNPLVLGENSGSRFFGITTRDSGSGPPHDVQFFVVDSGGEKVVTASASLPSETRVMVEAEHTGSAIRIRVNGGAWTTTAAGPIANLTGFPRIGHCGTSYQGRYFAAAIWRDPPSDPERATMLARFEALPNL